MDTKNYDAIQAGWSAHGRDGGKVGEIEEVGRDYLLVTKGFIFTTDLYIPRSAIGDVDTADQRVYLSVAKDEVENQGWTEPPAAETSTAAGGTTTGRGTATDENQGVRVPLREEQLRAGKTTQESGEVRVGKNVREDQATLDVPVTHDEVEVRRVATDRPATGDAGAIGEGETLRVPVSSEHVEVTKEPRVTEEIEVTKRPVTETQRVTETVRREEAQVDESGNVLTGAGAAMTGSRGDLDDTNVSGMRTDDMRTDEALEADEDDDLRR